VEVVVGVGVVGVSAVVIQLFVSDGLETVLAEAEVTRSTVFDFHVFVLEKKILFFLKGYLLFY
jgi:hypothetical protein